MICLIESQVLFRSAKRMASQEVSMENTLSVGIMCMHVAPFHVERWS